MGAFLPLLSYLIPIVGKLLLMLPVVPNKIIPFLLGAFNIIHKFWLLAGFPTAVAAMAGGNHFAVLGIGTAVPVIWGCLEQYLWHRFYEGHKAQARLEGKTSWWELGKSDMWAKK